MKSKRWRSSGNLCQLTHIMSFSASRNFPGSEACVAYFLYLIIYCIIQRKKSISFFSNCMAEINTLPILMFYSYWVWTWFSRVIPERGSNRNKQNLPHVRLRTSNSCVHYRFQQFLQRANRRGISCSDGFQCCETTDNNHV